MTAKAKLNIFLGWARGVFDANAWYTLTSTEEEIITRTWGNWYDTLVSWGIVTGDETPEQFREALERMPHPQVMHIGEAMYEEENFCHDECDGNVDCFVTKVQAGEF